MQLSRAEAVAALDDVSRTENRTSEARAYQAASPHLLLWGPIWLVGYALLGALPPSQWWLVWVPLDIIGVIGSIIIGARNRVQRPAGYGWKSLVVAAVMVMLMASAFLMFRADRPEPYIAYPAVVIAAAYCLLGLYRAPRLLWLGAALFVLTVMGYLFVQPYLAYWMASVGGGALMAGGLWMRRI